MDSCKHTCGRRNQAPQFGSSDCQKDNGPVGYNFHSLSSEAGHCSTVSHLEAVSNQIHILFDSHR